MIWAERTFPSSDPSGWLWVTDKLDEMSGILDDPGTLMLVSASPDPMRTTLIMRLPSPAFLESFPGFAPIHAACLPRQARPIRAKPGAFEAFFRPDR